MAEANEPPPRGNFTLTDYLEMVDGAESARRGSAGSNGNFDGASVETHASESQASDAADEAMLRQHHNDITPSLSGMGIDQLLDISAFLSLADRCRMHMTCKHMHAQQEACDKSIRTLCVEAHNLGRSLLSNRVEEATRNILNIEGSAERSAMNIIHRSRVLQWSKLSNLRELNVGKRCTNHLLKLISGISTEGNKYERGDMLLSELEILNMSGSYVSEPLLLNFAMKDGSGRIRSNLRELDVTFCSNITYESAIQFRTLLPHCLLRRLPRWMCGHTHTPFGENGRDEIHTYWPDGAFRYNRESQSRGFVIRVDLLGSDPNHVSEKLQFIDMDGMSLWFRVGFHPSVSLLRLHDKDGSQNVLVAQRKGGIRHLKFFPKKVQANIIPIGTSKHFDLEGNCLTDEDVEASAQGRNSSMAMVSNMRKTQLKKEEELSPLGLVREIELHFDRQQNDEEVRALADIATGMGMNAEEIVDRALGGAPSTENDFIYNEDMVAFQLDFGD